MYKLFKRAHRPGVLEVQMAGACDPGRNRELNEDAIGITDAPDRGYYFGIVCDGMGGHNSGEVASALAVELVSLEIAEHIHDVEVSTLLDRAFVRASDQIDAQAEINPDAEGMGCTAVAVLGIDERLYVAHCGDSRAYRLREGQLEQLTADHTMVQEMVDNGLLTAEQAAVHPYRGRISACLGHGKKKHNPTVREIEFWPGDSLLLCSDGLSDVVPEAEIAALVGQRDIRDAIGRLVEAANNAGGPDNVSAVVLRRRV
ncbi:MAG: serine/threonine-protein phosphatase [Myxococcales bacterium FL481]|nr:MAG: serine/threonine-protein phosphatase [Myxococcales bacterium FL481]